MLDNMWLTVASYFGTDCKMSFFFTCLDSGKNRWAFFLRTASFWH